MHIDDRVQGCDNVSSWAVQVTPPSELALPVWPVPTSVTLAKTHSSSLRVSSTFQVTLPSGAPPALADSATRYESLIRSGTDASITVSEDTSTLEFVTITLGSASDSLSLETDYSYTLVLPSSTSAQSMRNGDVTTSTATVTAATMYGAMYGLETLSQLALNGSVPAVAVGATVSDSPQYR